MEPIQFDQIQNSDHVAPPAAIVALNNYCYVVVAHLVWAATGEAYLVVRLADKHGKPQADSLETTFLAHMCKSWVELPTG